MVRFSEQLRQHISRLEKSGAPQAVKIHAFDNHVIDQYLPLGGLQDGALHEFCAAPGLCHETAATLFMAGILARMTGQLLWVVKQPDFFTPGLARVGLSSDRIIFAEAGDDTKLLAVMEEGLRHGGLCAVVGELSYLPLIAARRLHLAARTSGVSAYALFRADRYKKQPTKEPTPAVTRWRITALPSHPMPTAGIGRAVWQIELTRCRDAEPALWIMEACDETGHLGVLTDFVNRPLTAEVRRAGA